MDTADECKAIWRRFVEEVPNKRNLDVVDELVDENAVFHMALVPEPVRGRESLKDAIKGSLAMWEAVNVEIAELVAEGAHVVALMTINGTMQGEFMGQSVDGRQLTMSVVHFLRFSRGRIVEDRQVTDGLLVLRQLGLAPQLA